MFTQIRQWNVFNRHSLFHNYSYINTTLYKFITSLAHRIKFEKKYFLSFRSTILSTSIKFQDKIVFILLYAIFIPRWFLTNWKVPSLYTYSQILRFPSFYPIEEDPDLKQLRVRSFLPQNFHFLSIPYYIRIGVGYAAHAFTSRLVRF